MHDIEISRRTIDPYDETGRWMDGDTREVCDHGTDTETYDPAYDGPEPLPWWNVRRYAGASKRERAARVAWAAERIGRTGAYEPSVYPVPAELSPHAWLSGAVDDSYTTEREEVSVRLTGDWSDAERAEVFRLVSAS
jgi:hypothetical protein